MVPAPVWIAGAGFSGAVVARTLAEAGRRVEVFDPRPHVAGNCHTFRDPGTGIMVHRYGPHILHTDDTEVWDLLTRHATIEPYAHRVLTQVQGRTFAMPINLGTINAFFGTDMASEEARAFVAARAVPIAAPANFEEQALSLIGPELYVAFFRGYTEKQWGRPPTKLPASIFRRLPLRFTDDTGYFDHAHQGLPREGYTALVRSLLDHPGIAMHLGTAVTPDEVPPEAHLFWSGPLDAFFAQRLGPLGYRTLDFDTRRVTGDHQGVPVMNYGDRDVPYTRVTEHRHFAPWESHAETLISTEYPRDCESGDIPYYPIRLAREKALLADYVALAEATQGVTFIGRLGTYRYLDMDVAIREALDTARAYLASESAGTPRPRFSRPPI